MESPTRMSPALPNRTMDMTVPSMEYAWQISSAILFDAPSVGGTNGLVGRNRHGLPVLDGAADNAFGAYDIVHNAFCRIHFHEGHVLVGCGVKIVSILLSLIVCPTWKILTDPITATRSTGIPSLFELFGQVQIDAVKVEFGIVEKHETLWPLPDDFSTQLASDRASRARHKN